MKSQLEVLIKLQDDVFFEKVEQLKHEEKLRSVRIRSLDDQLRAFFKRDKIGDTIGEWELNQFFEDVERL